MTRWLEFPVDTYLDRRHRNWVLAEEFGDVRFSGDVVLVDPVRAERIARALLAGRDLLLEDAPALPTRMPAEPELLPAPSVGRQAPKAASAALVRAARSRWRDILGWLGIIAGAGVFLAALAMPLDDPALVVALTLALRGGRLILDVDS